MGRLFWKFFISIWLAQFCAMLGVGAFMWINRPTFTPNMVVDQSPSASFMVEAAASTLRHGGINALQQLLQQNRHLLLYAVDEHNQDLLKRDIPASTVLQARTLLGHEGGLTTILEVAANDGHHYLLFQPLQPHGERRLPEREGGIPQSPADFNRPNAPSGFQPPPLNASPSSQPEWQPPRPSFEATSPLDQPPRPPDGGFYRFIPIATALLASLISAFVLAWYFSKPIRILRTAIAAAEQGNLDVRPGETMGRRHDELADLSHDFDRMAHQLQTLMASQQRLMHDVSHELRSPLARMQLAIGLARQQPGKLEESMRRIERESERMDQLVGELLTLARLESNKSEQGATQQERINIAPILRDIVADANFEAKEQDKQVKLEQCDPLLIEGQPELLHRAIENVVRNAVRHTPTGSTVVLTTQIDPARTQWQLQINDQGPGVADTELESIFEPFFRGSQSSNQGPHLGLGLAIARQIIQSHHGHIRAQNRPQGGLSVTIDLPIQGDQTPTTETGKL